MAKAAALSQPIEHHLDDLIIAITPRDDVTWQGTSEQLRGEGLIPPDCKWPERSSTTCWDRDGFRFCLARCRPPGLKGPMRLWVDGDYWRLRRGPMPEEAADSSMRAQIYEKEQELLRARFRLTHGYAEHSRRVARAHRDLPFQAFLGTLDMKRRAA